MIKKMMSSKVIVSLFLLLAVACDGEDDPQERISKLRALGVESNPTVASAETAAGTAELTFYTAVPLGKTVTFEPFADSEATYSLAQEVKVVAGSDTYKDYNAFRVFSVKATMVIPPADTLKISSGDSRRLRYGMRFNSESEEEKVVGDILVFPSGSEQTSWKSPTAEIEAPGDSVNTGSDADLKGKLTKPQNEGIRVGWFVSGGSVKNRRSTSTSWKVPDAGNHTVVLTVHGTQSRGFGIFVKDVQVK